MNRLRISIEAPDKEGYMDIANINIDWENFLSNLTYLYEHKGEMEIYIKTVDAAVPTKEKRQKFYDIFENICDKIFIEQVIPMCADYDKIYEDFHIEKEKGLRGSQVQDVNICTLPFYSCVINPDGEVTPCCSDWKRDILLGNVKDVPFYEVWNGEKYKKFLKGMLENGRKKNHFTCAKCEYPCYDMVDNIDPYVDKIKEKF